MKRQDDYSRDPREKQYGSSTRSQTLKMEDSKTYKGKYEESMPNEVRRLARFGLTNEEIAEFYGIGLVTLERYKRDIPEFRQALDEGRMIDSMKVVDSLHKQALGYEVVEHEISQHMRKDGKIVELHRTTTKHVQPNVTAAIYLLKTRHGDKWMDVIKTEQTNNLNIMVKNVDFSDMSTEELMTLKKLGIKRIPEEFRNQKQLPTQNVKGN